MRLVLLLITYELLKSLIQKIKYDIKNLSEHKYLLGTKRIIRSFFETHFKIKTSDKIF